jgi:hypothetical protein
MRVAATYSTLYFHECWPMPVTHESTTAQHAAVHEHRRLRHTCAERHAIPQHWCSTRVRSREQHAPTVSRETFTFSTGEMSPSTGCATSDGESAADPVAPAVGGISATKVRSMSSRCTIRIPHVPRAGNEHRAAGAANMQRTRRYPGDSRPAPIPSLRELGMEHCPAPSGGRIATTSVPGGAVAQLCDGSCIEGPPPHCCARPRVVAPLASCAMSLMV